MMNKIRRLILQFQNAITKLVQSVLGDLADDRTQAVFFTGTIASLGLGICLALFIGMNVASNQPLTGEIGEVPKIRLVNRFGDVHELKVELARTPDQQRTGLMFRTFMPSDQGMLFMFDEAAPRTFWMQNTLISLDIIFLDANGRVVTIHKRTKTNQTTETYPSTGAAKFVLETNADWADQSQLQIGDQIQFLL
jgi:uncharacterized membrane protein (UPF0127 family)